MNFVYTIGDEIVVVIVKLNYGDIILGGILQEYAWHTKSLWSFHVSQMIRNSIIFKKTVRVIAN